MKKIFIPIITLITLLSSNGLQSKNDFILVKNVNKMETSESVEQYETEYISEELESYNSTSQVQEEELSNSVNDFLNEFIIPIIVAISGLNLGAIGTFLGVFFKNKQNNKQNSKKMEETDRKYLELINKVNTLLDLLEKSEADIRGYSSITNKASKTLVNAIEKECSGHRKINDTTNLLLDIILIAISHNEQLISNGTAETINEKIKLFKGQK